MVASTQRSEGRKTLEYIPKLMSSFCVCCVWSASRNRGLFAHGYRRYVFCGHRKHVFCVLWAQKTCLLRPQKTLETSLETTTGLRLAILSPAGQIYQQKDVPGETLVLQCADLPPPSGDAQNSPSKMRMDGPRAKNILVQGNSASDLGAARKTTCSGRRKRSRFLFGQVFTALLRCTVLPPCWVVWVPI